MSDKFKMSDAIIARFVGIIQEAMIMGVDVVDLFREMEMKPAPGEPTHLVLTEEYEDKVRRWHDQIESELVRRRDTEIAMVNDPNVIVGTGDRFNVAEPPSVAEYIPAKKAN